MGLGEDIRLTLDDVGYDFTILRDSGNVVGEHLITKSNSQTTKPFIREFFLDAMFEDLTQVNAGDIVQIDVTKLVYLVVNKTPYVFENEIIKWDGVLYKCNVSGELFRPSGENSYDSQTYQVSPVWETIKANCYALQTESLFGNDLEENQALGQFGIKAHELFLPGTVDIQVLDRYQPVSGEYYKVETLAKRRFNNVVVATLSEDTR